jgi:serine/threonine protein kinase
MTNSIGQQIGNYRLTRLLGHGGFADVYLGEHVYLATLAAIKILHAQLEHEDIETFRNEALTIAHLIHPHIVRVLDFDVENGTPFLVLDYAPNGNLRERFPKGSRLPSASVVSYAKQVAAALQYAHDRKLVHRDVKPENMLLGQNLEILLSDFGIALVAESSKSQKTEEEVVGTMAYMAPEQLQGKARPASDQYALGAVVYEWLCGKRPFTGSYLEIVAQHLSSPPTPLRDHAQDIPFAVEQVVMRALAKDPHQRFPRVQDFADALEMAYQAPLIPVVPPTVPSAQAPSAQIPPTPSPAMASPPTPSASSISQRAELPSWQQSQWLPPLTEISRRGKSVIKGGLKLILGTLLVISILLCSLGYLAYNRFFPHPTPLTSADTAQASALTNSFITDLNHHNYSHAYSNLGDTITRDTSQQAFVQEAQNEDNCYGVVTASTRVDNATSTQGDTVMYAYTMKRTKMSKTYQLHLSLQRNSAGSWRVSDYNSNVNSVQPTCSS